MMVKSKNKVNIDEKITSAMGSITSIVVHTILFLLCLSMPFFTKISYDTILLVLTTIVSLEAIYLALFIQISINRQSQNIEEIQEDVEEIQEDVEEIQEDVEEVSESVDGIEKDIEEISEDVEEISDSVDEIEKDVDEISTDVDNLTEDLGEIQEDMEEEVTEEEKEVQRKNDQKLRLEKLENMLSSILKEIGNLKK